MSKNIALSMGQFIAIESCYEKTACVIHNIFKTEIDIYLYFLSLGVFKNYGEHEMDAPSKKILIGLAAAFAVVSGGIAYDRVSKRNKTPEQACAELQKSYSDITAKINKKNQESSDPTDLQMETVITNPETGAVVCHAKASTDYKKPAM